MSDDADWASDLAEADRMIAIDRARAAPAIGPANASGICVDCDDRIPPERLAILPTAIRCQFCQTEAETK